MNRITSYGYCHNYHLRGRPPGTATCATPRGVITLLPGGHRLDGPYLCRACYQREEARRCAAA